jgi:hypothetical protein
MQSLVLELPRYQRPIALRVRGSVRCHRFAVPVARRTVATVQAGMRMLALCGTG